MLRRYKAQYLLKMILFVFVVSRNIYVRRFFRGHSQLLPYILTSVTTKRKLKENKSSYEQVKHMRLLLYGYTNKK